MPALPQTLQLPRPTSSDPEALRRWANDYISAMQREWTTMVYTLNALSLVDTIANRSATPDLDHIFFTASDTGQMYVAVEGAWYEFGPGAGAINVKGYGAKADGTDDTAAITLAIAAADAAAGAERAIFWPAGTYNVTQISFKGVDNVLNIALGSVVINGTGSGVSVIDMNGGTSSTDANRTAGIEFRGKFIVNASGTYQTAVDISSMTNSRIQLAASGSYSLTTVRVDHSWDNDFHLVSLSNSDTAAHVLMLGSSDTVSSSVNRNNFLFRISGTGSADTQTGLFASGIANQFQGDISAVGTGINLGSTRGSTFTSMYCEAVKVCVTAHPTSSAHTALGNVFSGGYYEVITNGTAFRLGSVGGSQFTTIISPYIKGVSGGSSRTAFDFGTTSFGPSIIDPHFGTDIDTLTTGTYKGGVGGFANRLGTQTVTWLSFPTTALPSTDTNTIDDYKERGTWTPVLTAVTPGDLAVTYTTQVGHYIKVGNKVTASFNIVTSGFTHTTASGNLLITGLPTSTPNLAAVNVSGYQAVGSLALSGMTRAGYTGYASYLSAGTTQVRLYGSGTGVARVILQITDFPTGGAVILTGTIDFESTS